MSKGKALLIWPQAAILLIWDALRPLARSQDIADKLGWGSGFGVLFAFVVLWQLGIRIERTQSAGNYVMIPQWTYSVLLPVGLAFVLLLWVAYKLTLRTFPRIELSVAPYGPHRSRGEVIHYRNICARKKPFTRLIKGVKAWVTEFQPIFVAVADDYRLPDTDWLLPATHQSGHGKAEVDIGPSAVLFNFLSVEPGERTQTFSITGEPKEGANPIRRGHFPRGVYEATIKVGPADESSAAASIRVRIVYRGGIDLDVTEIKR